MLWAHFVCCKFFHQKQNVTKSIIWAELNSYLLDQCVHSLRKVFYNLEVPEIFVEMHYFENFLHWTHRDSALIKKRFHWKNVQKIKSVHCCRYSRLNTALERNFAGQKYQNVFKWWSYKVFQQKQQYSPKLSWRFFGIICTPFLRLDLRKEYTNEATRLANQQKKIKRQKPQNGKIRNFVATVTSFRLLENLNHTKLFCHFFENPK